MESGKVVLVTAAAGGTGQFAVQVLINLFPFVYLKCVRVCIYSIDIIYFNIFLVFSYYVMEVN